MGFFGRHYPRVHANLEHEVHGGHSLLYRWKGSDPSRQPVLLMSHIDVVPVEPGSESSWTHPPFSGDHRRRLHLGPWRTRREMRRSRAARGNRTSPGAQASAQPATCTLPSGTMRSWAAATGKPPSCGDSCRRQGVRFRFVLDEGGGLTEGIIDGINETGRLCRNRREGLRHDPAQGRDPGRALVDATAAHGRRHGRQCRGAPGVEPVPGTDRRSDSRDARLSRTRDALAPPVALANRWLTGGFIARQFAAKPSLNALIRTTMAATVARGGETENVLPTQAETIVNLRLLPGDTFRIGPPASSTAK